MRSLAVALAAGVGCAGSAAPAAPAPPVATVTLAPPVPSVEAVDAEVAVADASPDVAPDAAARPRRAVRPGCSGPALDLGTAQSACRCNDVPALGPVDCPYDRDVDTSRARRDLRVSVQGPATVPPGGTVTLDVRVVNGGTEDAAVLLIDDDPPRVGLLDAQGKEVTAIQDRSCPAVDSVRMVQLAVVVLPPGGALSTSVGFAAIRMRRVGRSYTGPRGQLSLAELRALGTYDCVEVPAGPLPRGRYELEVRMPLWPEDLGKQLEQSAAVEVK
jgi:hypothetical protein